MALGADYSAWYDYLAHGYGEPNSRVTSPNGDVVVFDATGGPDYTIGAPSSGTYARVEQDPGSMFYGKTEEQKAAYWAAQGVAVAPDKGTLTGNETPEERARILAANQARLMTTATTDPFVKQALANLNAGIHIGINDPDTLARTAARVAADRVAQDAYHAAELAWYGAGNRTAFPGILTGGISPAAMSIHLQATGAAPPSLLVPTGDPASDNLSEPSGGGGGGGGGFGPADAPAASGSTMTTGQLVATASVALLSFLALRKRRR